jgi:hypothetical protein
MASKQYVPGPAQVYANVAAGNTWAFLGLSMDDVRVSTSVLHESVQADYAGGMPADQQMMGEEIYVSFRLSRYVEEILTLCSTRLNNTYSSGPGSGLSGALGALMGAQGNCYSLAIVSTYAAEAAFSDMVPGIFIPKAYMANALDVGLSTKVKNPSVVFSGLATFGLDGSYSLFSYTVPSDLPGVS